MKKVAILLAFAFTAGASYATASDKDSAATAVNKAVHAIESAAAVGGEWRDSYKILGKAKKAWKSGEYDKAEKLAHKAMRQGEIGKSQALAERGASIPAYVYK